MTSKLPLRARRVLDVSPWPFKGVSSGISLNFKSSPGLVSRAHAVEFIALYQSAVCVLSLLKCQSY